VTRPPSQWDDAQLAWRPRLDAWGETSLAGLRMAGDGGGIAGALAAELSGALAALGAACALDRLSVAARDRRAAAYRRLLLRQLRVRPFLDALYRPPDWVCVPTGDTVICRALEGERVLASTGGLLSATSGRTRFVPSDRLRLIAAVRLRPAEDADCRKRQRQFFWRTADPSSDKSAKSSAVFRSNRGPVNGLAENKRVG
jgi:hypothetical protein